MSIEMLTHLIQSPSEYRRGLIELPPHPDTLRALTCEQKRNPMIPAGESTLDHPRHGRTSRQRSQPSQHILRIAAKDHRAMLQRRPADRQRKPNVGQPEFRVARHTCSQPLGLTAQTVHSSTRKNPWHSATDTASRHLKLSGIIAEDRGLRHGQSGI
jgi:hypothetical protein